MPHKIERLSPHIVHQIAAGEVIERPASALKELLENSLDAGASRVTVTYDQGGLENLTVEDDGDGIYEQDMPLVFEPHATSKLRKIEDLEALESYGFRGEAMGSMAAVGDLEVESSAREADAGLRARVSFGSPLSMLPIHKRVGTRVTLRHLFRRHPARLKYMKSPRAEALQLGLMFKRYALARPDIRMEMRDLQGDKVRLFEKQDALQRVLAVVDSESPKNWLHLEKMSFAPWSLEIVALKPSSIGKEKAQVQLFLNGRPIRDPKMEFAVKRAYENFSEFPRDCAAFVWIEGPGDLVDVNVHPMKLEVRFLEPDSLFSLIVRRLRESFESLHKPVPSRPFEPIDSPRDVSFQTSKVDTVAFEAAAPEIRESSPAILPTMPLLFETPRSFEYLGSFDDTYLIARREDSLYLFDQHALHERILYEELMQRFKKGEKIPSQRLLFPIPLVVEKVELLLEEEALLERLGFELRVWGDGKIQMVAAPAILKRGHQEVLRKLSECRERAEDVVASETLSTVACHSAVRAHDRLSSSEIQKLFEKFESKDALGHCPHGRPTFLRFEKRDLEKLFHRVL